MQRWGIDQCSVAPEELTEAILQKDTNTNLSDG
uniref:Uncharacterized protein n=1 Tax=Arundo donax TaxID=35708 RepID=A0A0A9AQZ2_ARUDO